jgi:succinoglycan biosynthesis transport protein ExoP
VSGRTTRSFSATAALWRHRWLAVVVMLTVLVAVNAWLRTAPRYYIASSTLTATPSASLLGSTGNFDNLETTLAQIANSQAVLSDVVGSVPYRRTVAQLRGEVSAVRVTGTVLIRISVTDRVPSAAADIANAVARALVRHDPSHGMFRFTTTDAAQVPTAFSSPNVKIDLLAGAALAVLLGVGTAIGYERLAGTVDTPRQLADATGADVLGVLTKPRRTSPTLAGAGFRSMRVALESVSKGEPLRPIVIMGLPPDPAFTEWVAWNAAVALAQAQHHVLLVDADIDRPHACDGSFGCTSPGLYGVLADYVGVDDATCPTSIEGLTVLPAGDAKGRPADALVESRFTKLLAEVADRFDVVVVAAPAVPFSADAAVFAGNGSLLIAVRAGRLQISKVQNLFQQRPVPESRAFLAVLIRRESRFRG